MGESFDRFVDELCTRNRTMRYIFVIATALTFIQLPILFATEAGSAPYVVSVMNLVGFVGFALASGGLIRYCHRRRTR